MKYNAPTKALFSGNRARFAAAMQPRHAAVFFSNEVLTVNADAHYRFSQNSNMYYLSGLDQEECILFLFPDAPKPEWKEVLFIRKTNETIQIWEGWKYSIEEAREASGIRAIRYVEEFEGFIRTVISHTQGFYLDFNEHERNGHAHAGPAHEFAQRLSGLYPGHGVLRAAPILERLRSIKSEEEIRQMREAISITEKAFRRILGYVKPGVMEYEIEAEIMHEFLRNRATGEAYGSIIASGRNACVLHYVLNNAPCKEGDVLLMDFGAEYGNYSADLSRSIPVSGRFSQRQKAVYNAVLRVMKAATQMLRPGTLLEEYHREVGRIMESELLGLGLLTKTDIENQNPDWPAYKKYFMHGTSHFLGLDTHDVGNRYEPMQPGMVFTCEPGIYILEENLGIRLENDILLTPDGNIDLMASIPLEADEIEDLMNR